MTETIPGIRLYSDHQYKIQYSPGLGTSTSKRTASKEKFRGIKVRVFGPVTSSGRKVKEVYDPVGLKSKLSK